MEFENPAELLKDKKALLVIGGGALLIGAWVLLRGRSAAPGTDSLGGDAVSGAVLAEQTQAALQEQQQQTAGAIGSVLEQVSSFQQQTQDAMSKQAEAEAANLSALSTGLGNALQQQQQQSAQVYGQIAQQVAASQAAMSENISRLTQGFQSQLAQAQAYRSPDPIYQPPQIVYAPAPMVQQTPPPQVAQVVNNTTMTPPTTRSYTVVSGDNLSTIAARNGISLAALLRMNPQFQSNPNLIHPGNTVYL